MQKERTPEEERLEEWVTFHKDWLEKLDKAIGWEERPPNCFVWTDEQGEIAHIVELDEKSIRPAKTLIRNMRSRIVAKLKLAGVE